MVIRADHDLLDNAWAQIVHHEEETGNIALPAVESIRFDEAGSPVISLIRPRPGTDTIQVFVQDFEQIDAVDRVTLLSLLEAVRECYYRGFGGAYRLKRVQHAGGLDYDFITHSEERSLSERPIDEQAQIWGLLRAIAVTSVNWVDEGASTPVIAR